MANQRARLHGSLLRAIDIYGYAETSVSSLCKLAGVSKRTFYEQFENKEACLLASYEHVVQSATERVTAACASREDVGEQFEAGLHALVGEIAEHPKAARLLLMEAAERGRAEASGYRDLRPDLERIVADGLRRYHAESHFAVVAARGIVFGVERVLRKALVENRLDDPAALAAWLTEWALSYGASPLGARGMEIARWSAASLQGTDFTGGSGTASPRTRVLRATAELVATNGPQYLTLARIAHRSHLSEEELRDHYTSVERCLIDALDLLALEALMTALEASRAAGEGTLRGACLGIMALVERVARDPVMRGAIFREQPFLHSSADFRGERFLQRVLDALLARHPSTSKRSWIVAEATVGALCGIITDHVRRAPARACPPSGVYITYLALAPTVGAEPLCSVLTQLAAGFDVAAPGAAGGRRTSAAQPARRTATRSYGLSMT